MAISSFRVVQDVVRGLEPQLTRINTYLNSVADAGLELTRLARRPRETAAQTLLQRCRELMATDGEAAGVAVAREVVRAYGQADAEQRTAFHHLLVEHFGVDPDAVVAAADAYRAQPDLKRQLALAHAVEAPRQELFRRINTAPDGVRTLVAMREAVLAALPANPGLAAIDSDLRHLLASWFNRGFLELRRLDWNSPAALLEKLIRYESVHAIHGWGDLRRRLAADDRRCFGFFHPALPDEPLIFVEVALVKGLPDAIAPLLDAAILAEEPDSAIFYSINNCQDGLRGISFGDFLIKQVVLELKREGFELNQYATLSPVPGFLSWLRATLDDLPAGLLESGERGPLMEILENPEAADAELLEKARPSLVRTCAWYLVRAKRGQHAADPVARFHLRNGARLERIDWLGDPSAKGLRQSAGLMVNYVYDPASIERNNEAYIREGRIIASTAVSRVIPRILRNA
ncbi:malonyl-CoA decarboxylase [Zavarzinia sp. CC-PAN008]|uniref:malonyl-CoA decarboxylase n=1 Tax=Zavarzinia sp. CC-PAN008 TaxID=3243332 RepID=UPI003F74373C